MDAAKLFLKQLSAYNHHPITDTLYVRGELRSPHPPFASLRSRTRPPVRGQALSPPWGQDTKRKFTHAKQFCSLNPLTGGNFRAFAFDYSQYGIFAQIQLHADLSVRLPGGYQR